MPARRNSSVSSNPMRLTLRQVEDWFAARGQRVLPFQKEAWRHINNGESGLIHAPTGTGKTLAAWFGALLAHAQQGSTAPALTVLWITPLRALATDTRLSIEAPLANLDISWTVGARTGDTRAGERAKQRKQLPSTLITTPESLSLLLSYADTAKSFNQLRMIVVDEWHELLGSKRGVQLELCLAHLRHRVPTVATWGLSATLGNLDEAATVLLGPNAMPRLIHGKRKKITRIRTLLPEDPQALPWAGHAGLHAVPLVAAALERAKSTLVFTNTRSQAERWFEALTLTLPDWLGQIGLHHGSIDFGIRRRIEDGLRDGTLRAVVATSSLDLGVDFTPVEQVIQVGSPKGVARLLQRAGRSGHQPGQPSEVLCVPTHALQVIEIAAARAAADAGNIEARRPLVMSLDVLVQHLVTLSLAGGVSPDQVLAEARDTHAFARLSDEAWRWVINFVTTGGAALKAYPDYQRLLATNGQLTIASRKLAQRHRMAIGTITSDSAMQVKFMKGGSLGTIEENTISRLKPGDAFLFSGRRLELVRVKDMTAYVRLASKKTVLVPRWQGGRLPLSTELGRAVLEQFEQFARHDPDSPELRNAASWLVLQQQHSELPGPDRLLVERTKSRDGFSLFVYPFAGRLVHEGLAALIAWRLSQQFTATFSLSANDYGFELLTRTDVPFTQETLAPVFSLDNLDSDILQAINATEMARRQFRDIARIAGLIFQGYPGSRKAVRQIQASSGLIYDVLVRYDPSNLLPQQALDEVLAAQFEFMRLRETLEAIAEQNIILVETKKLTPLAFPLWADRIGARLSSESWKERIEKMRASLQRADKRNKTRNAKSTGKRRTTAKISNSKAETKQ